VASDEESTQPIDIEALRGSSAGKPATDRSSRPEGYAHEHPPVGADGLETPRHPAKHRAATGSSPTLGSAGTGEEEEREEQHEVERAPSSVTRVDVASPAPPEAAEEPPKTRPLTALASITAVSGVTLQRPAPTSLPGTVRATEVAEALAAKSALLDDTDERGAVGLGDTDAHAALDALDAGSVEDGVTATRLPGDDDPDRTRISDADGDAVRAAFAAVASTADPTVVRQAPASALLETARTPSARSRARPGGLESGATTRRPLSSASAVPPATEAEPDVLELSDDELESEPDLGVLARTGGDDDAGASLERTGEHTMMSFGATGEQRASLERTGEQDPLGDSGSGLVSGADVMEARSDENALPRFPLTSADDVPAVRLDELDAGADVHADAHAGADADADAEAIDADDADIELLSGSHPAPAARSLDSRLDAYEAYDEVSYDDEDGGATNFLRRPDDLLARAPAPAPASPHAGSIDALPPLVPLDDLAEPGDATETSARSPLAAPPAPAPAPAPPPAPAPVPSRAPSPSTPQAGPTSLPGRSVPPPPPGPPFVPPAPVGRQILPAFEVDTDSDEDQLQKEGSFRALLDLYRLRLAGADTPMARAALLHKIASVYEYKLQELTPAFDALVEAFDLRPGDEDIVMSLERVAKELGRVGELAERARRNLHTADAELKVLLLGHLLYWYERVLGRAAEMSPFLSELERLDKSHPVALRRQAQLAAANGDVKTQRDLLVRALDRTFRRDEKVALHLALAGSYQGTPEATRHYESALAIDSSSVVALQGYERIGREQGKHGQVEWTLERQIDVALTTAEKIDALLKLAELHETKYLRRERAAEILERVLELEPAHPQALKALERCYHALRDWPRLARTLRARADNSYDKKQKVELLELAAEVLEAKLGDPASAIEVHRDLLVVDPKHRRALADLARLYEKLGDWGNMATYKARVAELAPSKRQASQLLVQLGDFLAAPERDAIAARLQYERAVAVDPTNAAAWEALQRIAAEAGDDRRVAACLSERARHVEAARPRAAIYVELANLHRQNGDERAAREAFEAAVKADPTNEAAAVVMLDVYTQEEKWREASPLCDLLVNAASRDGDEEARFTRLRLATRIAAALGDADRAMTSALAALDLAPDDEDAKADLVAVCAQCRSAPKVVARAKEALSRIASGRTALPASVSVGLAQLQRDAGEIDAAVATLERALPQDPDDPEVLKELAEGYLAQGDFARACKLKVDMARNATTADARFQLLVDAGEIWAKKADELDKAATVFEEARQIRPLDHWLLHTLMWLYGERHRWDDLSNVLESIAQIQESPERKAKSFFAMAQLVLEKMGDPIRAAELFDQVLDIDRTRLDAFEQLVRALTEAKDWEALERSYRKMIARVKDSGPPPGAAGRDWNPEHLTFALFQQLGLIYRDRLEDAERAFEAFEAAARLRPQDTGVRKIVTELLVVTDNVDNAVARTRELIALDPHDAELYAELYELFLRQHYFDKAWCAVNVLAQQRELTEEQARFHADYPPAPLSEVPGQIVEQAWRSHILHADLDPRLTNLFALMTPAVARMRYAQLRPDQLVFAAGRPFTGAHSRACELIRTTFANAAEILHMQTPELLLGDPSAPMPFAPALAPYGAILVAVPAAEARVESIVYVVGKRLAEQRPELAARAFFPSISDLTALLATAVRVSRQEGAKDAAGRALDASFSAVLLPHERDGIRAIVMQTAMEGGLVDVKRWSQAADLSSMRAGLLLAGDVGPARKVMLAEPQSTADLPPRERIGELYKFATSDLYSDLRGAIGVAVQG